MNQVESVLKLTDRIHEGLIVVHSQALNTDFAAETDKATHPQIVNKASMSVRAQVKSGDELLFRFH